MASIRWNINPLQLIQIGLIIALGIFGYIQWNQYIDAKYKLAEHKEKLIKIEAELKADKEKLQGLKKKINGYKVKIAKWEKRQDEIKKPTNITDIERMLNSGKD